MIRQTLTFQEDADVVDCAEASHEICIYMPTAKFHLAFVKCSRAGIATTPDMGGWSEASHLGEFCVSGCFDPAPSGSSDLTVKVLALRHVLRSPEHAACPPLAVVSDAGAEQGA